MEERAGSQGESGETEFGTEEEYYYRRNGRPALVNSYEDRGLASEVKALRKVDIDDCCYHTTLKEKRVKRGVHFIVGDTQRFDRTSSHSKFHRIHNRVTNPGSQMNEPRAPYN